MVLAATLSQAYLNKQMLAQEAVVFHTVVFQRSECDECKRKKESLVRFVLFFSVPHELSFSVGGEEGNSLRI